MRSFVANQWEKISSSLWFVPALFVGTAIIVAATLPIAERSVGAQDGAEGVFLFQISPGAARLLLSTVAGSLITVVAVVFSITFLSIQLAASRYTPRLTAGFMRDRTNQLVLGLYLATFAHAIVLMMQIGDEPPSPFVPTLSLAINVAFALTSLGGFIWFMHHISVSLQVAQILDFIGSEARTSIERVTVISAATSADPAPYETMVAICTQHLRGEPKILRAHTSGYLRRIDRGQLMWAIGAHAKLVQVMPTIGDFVHPSSELLRSWANDDEWEPDGALVRMAFVFGNERSSAQDPLFGLEQLVDIGLRALSPGINDQKTAIQVLDQIGAATLMLVNRQPRPSATSTSENSVYLFPEPTFGDYVEVAFGPLRRAGGSLEVLTHVLDTMQAVLNQSASNDRKAVFRPHIEGVMSSLHSLDVPAADRHLPLARCERLLQMLPGKPA